MSLLVRRYSLPLETQRERMERLWEGEWPFGDWQSAEGAHPPANVYDTPEVAVVEFEVPGIPMKDLELTIAGGSVTLKAKRAVEGDIPPEKHFVRERWRGEFGRTLTLPGIVDSSAATAALKNGILTVTVPKKAETRPRKIAVNVA